MRGQYKRKGLRLGLYRWTTSQVCWVLDKHLDKILNAMDKGPLWDNERDGQKDL